LEIEESTVSDMMQSEFYDGQYTENLPVRYQRNLTSGEFFEMAEKAELYTIRRTVREVIRNTDCLVD
jgi:hypothetical protein